MGARRLIFVSFLFVPLLQIWPLDEPTQMWRPAFPLLFVAYWVYTLPSYMGFLGGFFCGLFIDLFTGLNVAHWAFPCGLLALFIQYKYTSLRSFSLSQQAFYISGMMGLALLAGAIITEPSIGFDVFSLIWRCMLSSALCWLMLMLWFEPFSRRYMDPHSSA